MSSQLIPDFNMDTSMALKAIFCGHFTLTTFSLYGMTSASAYAFYNGFLLIFILWAQFVPAENSEFPLFHSVVTNVFSVLFDIITLASGFYLEGSGIAKFSFAMCIIHLLARFPSTFLLFRIKEQRRSLAYAGGMDGSAGRPGLSGYEDLPSSYASGVPRGDPRGTVGDTRPLPP